VHLADATFAPVRDFYVSSSYAQHRTDPDTCDFTFGNPHEMPLGGLVSAIRERALPHDKNWFAYKTSEAESQALLAESVGRELGLSFEPADIALTAGAFAAIMVAFRLVLDAGDEVVFSEPAWFCYEPMLLAADAAIYPWTLISYSYGKVLLAPGQRLGYLALSPLMPSTDRQALRNVMFSAQMALGWCFPNAVMQYAVPDLEQLSIDQVALARRRDLLTEALMRAGFEVLRPEGTFYLRSKWPPGDPEQHWNALADRKVFVMPGSLMHSPAHLRISLTASDRMVERALPAFAVLAQHADRPISLTKELR
jgi:aspartate/methionine/tyrosine aminotransferase